VTGELRPRGISEILDAAFKLFRRHWRPLTLSVVGLILPVQILSAAVTAAIAPEQFDLASTESGVDDDELNVFVAGQAVVGVLSIVTIVLATAVCLKAVVDAQLGVDPDWRRSLRFALARVGGLLGVSLLGAFGLVLALLAFIVPAIWLGVAWSVAVPALLLERLGPAAALSRSFALVRGRWWASFGVLLVGLLLASLIGALIQGLVMALPQGLADDNVPLAALAAALGGTLAAAITTPYSAAVITLLYLDLRVRKEGFDVRRLGDGEPALDAPDEPEAPSSGWAPPTPAPAPGGWLPPRPGGSAVDSKSPGDAGPG
jgi:hypothetical protein